jgi:hypothetical protein
MPTVSVANRPSPSGPRYASGASIRSP